MKKILLTIAALIVSAVMVFAFTSCGPKPNNDKTTEEPSSSTQQVAAAESSSEEASTAEASK